MKIRSLELENFRKFAGPIRVAGFADGINVLCGPQEFGKSTILAAIRGLLFQRYRSKVEEVRNMQPLGSAVAPVLAMEFDLAEGRYRIEKRFLHREHYARLALPDGRRLEGDAAEEELQRRLGFAEPGKQGSNVATPGIWGALWVPTRASFMQPDMPDGARRTFQDCLDAEVGALTGGARGQELLAAAKGELAAYLDGHGKPKGRYKQAATRIADLESTHLPKLRQEQQQLAGDLEDLARREAELRRETATDDEDKDRAAIIDTQARRDAAMRLADQITAARSEHRLALERTQQAEDEQKRRRDRAEAIAVAGSRVSEQAERESVARNRSSDVASEVARLRQVLRELETRQHEADSGVHASRSALEAARLNEDLSGLEQVLTRARAAQARLNALSGQMSAIKVDQTALGKINRATREAEAARASLTALATRIAFEIEPTAAARVTIGGRPLPQPSLALSAVDETRIAITGVGSITIQPVIKDRAALDGNLQKAERTLATLLRTAEVADANEAQAQWTERQRLTAEIELAKSEVELHAPAKPGLEPGPDALSVQVEQMRASLANKLAALGLEDAAGRQEAETCLHAAEAAARTLSEETGEARRALGAPEALASERQAALAQAQADHRSAASDLESKQREQTAALAVESDEALGQRIEAAKQGLELSSALLDSLTEQDTGETVELLDARLGRLQAKIGSRRDRLEGLRSAIQGLRIRIAMQEGDGIGERIARHERELAQLQEEQSFFAREVRVLQLLIGELASAERVAKERYMAPIVQRIQPYLRQLLPGATVECNEDLIITGILRDGNRSEEFERLSDGTQEQIAVLTRLAFAELLVDRSKPAAVILDDALAHSDPDRMERMFDILTHAARKTQIIVFGCNEADFAALPGARLTLEEDSADRA